MERAEAVADLKATFLLLDADLREAIAYARSIQSPYAERALFRAHFALIEGLFHQLREVAIASNADSALLSAAEVDLLSEKCYRLDKKGSVVSEVSFGAFLPKILFTMRSYAKIHGAQFEPNISLNGWNAMKKAVRVRHRVMHPKSAADINLTQEDMATLPEASNWWQDELLRLYESCREADEFWRERLSENDV